MIHLKTFLGGTALWLATALSLFAHDPGLSSIRATVSQTSVETVFTIHFADLAAATPDLDANSDGLLDADEFAKARPRLVELARQEVEIALGPEDAIIPLTPDADARVDLIGNNNLQMTVRYRIAGPVSGDRLTIASRLIGQLPRGHRQFIEVILGSDGRGIGEGFLIASANRLGFHLPPLAPLTTSGPDTASVPPRQTDYSAFFLLGVNHLLTGYDHLLFLAGLLIVCRSLLKAFQMLTLFTIAHSVTLTLVTLDLIKPSNALVEPTIAASIAYIGIENILRPRADLSWRGALTFLFGLVHGMGFASVLKELGVGTHGASGVFQPLLYFSLGLETTQLGLAALVFPVLLSLRTHPVFARVWVPAFSSLVALAGLYWFFERTLFGGR